MRLIERQDKLDEMVSVINTPDIKIITGIRRAGKSVLLSDLKKHLLSDAKTNIIQIDFQLTESEEYASYVKLEEYIESQYQQEKENYLLIDEVQTCDLYEKALRSLEAKKKYHIYVTGLNAMLQASDIATLLVGRTYEIEVFPFSFKEFLRYYEYANDRFTRNQALDNYLKIGGMPGSYLYGTLEQKYRYLEKDVLGALINKDIIKKRKIRNTAVFNGVLDFLTDNLGNTTSAKTIADALQKKGLAANHLTVSKYINYFCLAYLFYEVKRYDVRGKRYLTKESKYYLADHSFKYAHLGTVNLDSGRALENIVAIELLRRYSEVYVGKLYQKEIDFVAMANDHKLYIQVAESINDTKTFTREVESLLAIKDNYPKLLLARTYKEPYDYNGIKVIDIADWLSVES